MYTVTVNTACETRTYTRRVAYRSCLQVPNVVTANGDGRNDTFAPQGLVGTGWSLTVFSRWGTQVYQTSSYQNEWGPDAAAGVYYYVLRHALTGVAYKGQVEVIR
jgi:gliding motility-associated-like protein